MAFDMSTLIKSCPCFQQPSMSTVTERIFI